MGLAPTALIISLVSQVTPFCIFLFIMNMISYFLRHHQLKHKWVILGIFIFIFIYFYLILIMHFIFVITISINFDWLALSKHSSHEEGWFLFLTIKSLGLDFSLQWWFIIGCFNHQQSWFKTTPAWGISGLRPCLKRPQNKRLWHSCGNNQIPLMAPSVEQARYHQTAILSNTECSISPGSSENIGLIQV